MSRYSESPSPSQMLCERGRRGGAYHESAEEGDYDGRWIGRSRSGQRGSVRGRGGAFLQPRSRSRSPCGGRSLDAPPRERRRRPHPDSRCPPEAMDERQPMDGRHAGSSRHRGERRRVDRQQLDEQNSPELQPSDGRQAAPRQRGERHGDGRPRRADDEDPRNRDRDQRRKHRSRDRDDQQRKMVEAQRMMMSGMMHPAAMQMAMMQQMGHMGMMHPSYMHAMQQQQKMMRKRDGQGADKQSDGSSSDSGSSSSSDSGPGNGVLNPAAAMAAMAAMQHHGHPWHPATASAAPPHGHPPLPPPPGPHGHPHPPPQTGPPPPGIPPPPPPPPPPPGTSTASQFSGSEESIEAYLVANPVDDDAGDRLRALPPHLAATVMARGPVNDSRDPTAVLMARLRAVEINRPPGEGSAQGGANALANLGEERPEKGMTPAGRAAKSTIENLIRDYRLSAGCAWMMRALPPDKQKLVAKIDPAGQDDPSGYVAEELRKIV